MGSVWGRTNAHGDDRCGQGRAEPAAGDRSLAAVRPRCRRCCGSRAACTWSSGRIVVEAELDTGSTARRLRKDIGEVFGHTSEVLVLAPARPAQGHRATSCGSYQDGEALARQTGLIDNHGRPVAGLPPPGRRRGDVRRRGGLAGGVPGARLADRAGPVDVAGGHLSRGRRRRSRWSASARRLKIQAKAREVRGVDRVVVRDGDAISALLTRLGAHDSVLAWEERRMRREVRATANRLANFDDANLRRSARAAVAAGARVAAGAGDPRRGGARASGDRPAGCGWSTSRRPWRSSASWPTRR